MSLSSDTEESPKTHAYCTLLQQDDAMVVQVIDSGICINFRRWLRVQSMISVHHPKTLLYCRSDSARKIEELNHLMNYYTMVHPFSTSVLYWEFLMFWAFIYMLVVDSVNALFLFSRTIDAINRFKFYGDVLFTIDIIHFFFVGYYNTKKSKTVFRPSFVASNYLKTHFIIDLLGILPMFPILMLWMNLIDSTEQGFLGIMKFLGLLRVFRMPRWLEAFDLLQDYLNYSSYVFKFLKTVFVYFAILFSLYTLLFVVTAYEMKVVTTFYFLDRYLDATLILLAVANGKQEYFTNEWILIISSFLLAGITLRLFLHVQVLQVWNKFASATSKQDVLVQHLNEYMKNKGLSMRVRERMWIYYKLKFLNLFYDERHIKYLLSDALRNDIIFNVVEKPLKNSPIFKNVSKRILLKIVASLKTEVFLPDDVIIRAGKSPTCMYFIYYGTIAVYDSDSLELFHLQDGASFAELSMLYDVKSPLTFVCVKPTEVFKLSKNDFYKILNRHEKLKLRILSQMQEMYLQNTNPI